MHAGKHNSVATELRTEQPSAGAQKACRRTEPARASASRASLALAALRLAHEHACADRARHAHCTRASLASDARALTRQHALKNVPCKNGVLASLATGSASAGALHAHLARTRAANALATSAARAAHASLTRCACHAPPPLSRVQRDEDNERDEDERHDEEDQGHDG